MGSTPCAAAFFLDTRARLEPQPPDCVMVPCRFNSGRYAFALPSFSKPGGLTLFWHCVLALCPRPWAGRPPILKRHLRFEWPGFARGLCRELNLEIDLQRLQ